MLHISTTNSKLGLIPSINLPPIITCRGNAPCTKDCYACKGNFRFANVKQSMRNNLTEYDKNPERYFAQIYSYLSTGVIAYRYFRFHSAGDIPCKDYLIRMLALAERLPGVQFLCFTKKYEIVNEVLSERKLPKNLHMVFSAWGEFVPENPYDLPVAYVKLDENTYVPDNAVKCSGHCTTCLNCWKLKNGEAVVFNKH